MKKCTNSPSPTNSHTRKSILHKDESTENEERLSLAHFFTYVCGWEDTENNVWCLLQKIFLSCCSKKPGLQILGEGFRLWLSICVGVFSSTKQPMRCRWRNVNMWGEEMSFSFFPPFLQWTQEPKRKGQLAIYSQRMVCVRVCTHIWEGSTCNHQFVSLTCHLTVGSGDAYT